MATAERSCELKKEGLLAKCRFRRNWYRFRMRPDASGMRPGCVGILNSSKFRRIPNKIAAKFGQNLAKFNKNWQKIAKNSAVFQTKNSKLRVENGVACFPLARPLGRLGPPPLSLVGFLSNQDKTMKLEQTPWNARRCFAHQEIRKKGTLVSGNQKKGNL